MIIRAITGIVYVLTVIGAIFFNPLVLCAYFLIIMLIGIWEYFNIAKKICSHNLITYFLSIVVYLLISQTHYRIQYLSDYCQTIDSILISLAIICALICFIKQIYSKQKQHFTSIAYSLLPVIYICMPLSLANKILCFNNVLPWLLMMVFVFAWANDTFAYLGGKMFGKHKLIEKISPKKTWEGLIFGVVFTLIAGFVIFYCLRDNKLYDFLQIWDYLSIAALTSLVGIYGDLTESMFKRQFNVKDSGKILPGHGGILDRFDILLLVLPIVYAYLIIRF